MNNNYNCYCVFDWDDKSWILNQLNTYDRVNIDDSELDIFMLNDMIAKKFLAMNGCARESSDMYNSRYIGLVHNNALIQVMQLKFDIDGEFRIAIVDYGTAQSYTVSNRYNKLIDFILKYIADPKELCMMIDADRVDSSDVESMHMKIHSFTSPKIWWSKGSTRIRCGSKKHQVTLLNNKWLPVADCGQVICVIH